MRHPFGAKPEGLSGGSLRQLLREGIAEADLFSAQVQFPNLFAHVFVALGEIADRNVARQLLNYWKVRVSEYQQIVGKKSASVFLKDEGLLQAAFSTLARLPRNSTLLNGDQDYISGLLSSMPVGRLVVFLDAPLEVASGRCEAGKGQVPPTVSLSNRKLILLMRDALKEIEVELLTIDATRPIREVHDQVSRFLHPREY